MWKPIAVLIVLVCCISGAETVGATTFEARDFDALASEADQVVIGTAAASSSRRTGAREIVTDYRFDDVEIVKGTAPAGSLTLTMLGGTVGSESLTVPGAPTFKRGIRYLVFITGNGSVMFPLVGGHQGIFQMRTNAASGVSRVHDYAGRPVTRLSGRASRELADRAGVDAGEPMTQEAFVDAIRDKVAATGAR